MCPERTYKQDYRMGEKKNPTHRFTTGRPHPPESLLSACLFVCLWVCEWEKQCRPVPQSPSTTVVVWGGGRKGAWKEVVFKLMSFSFNQWVRRPSGAHRHAIPSPTDIIIRQPLRGSADGWGGRGAAARTQELFTLRRDKDGGGRRKGDVGSLTLT